jgi:hypothetical protein
LVTGSGHISLPAFAETEFCSPLTAPDTIKLFPIELVVDTATGVASAELPVAVSPAVAADEDEMNVLTVADCAAPEPFTDSDSLAPGLDPLAPDFAIDVAIDAAPDTGPNAEKDSPG